MQSKYHTPLEDVLLLVTPQRTQIFCTHALAPIVRLAIKRVKTPTTVYEAPEKIELMQLKMKVLRIMLQQAAKEDVRLLIGARAASDDEELWPLISAAFGGKGAGENNSQAQGADHHYYSAFHRMLAPNDNVHHGSRSIFHQMLLSAASYVHGGCSVMRARALDCAKRWQLVLELVDRSAQAHNLMPLTEKKLEASFNGGDDDDSFRVQIRLGVRTCKQGNTTRGAKPLYSAGVSNKCAIHMTWRVVDKFGMISACRSYFFSTGQMPTVFQHRIFSDGSVVEPIVEDEICESVETQRAAISLREYAAIVTAAQAVASKCATESSRRITHDEAKLTALPILSKLSLHERATLSYWTTSFTDKSDENNTGRRMTNIKQFNGTKSTYGNTQSDDCAYSHMTDDVDQFDDDKHAQMPMHWLIHHVRFELECEEGLIEYEQPFILDDQGGYKDVISLPEVCCWIANDEERGEAERIRETINSKMVCNNPSNAISRLRAGEHNVLQVLLTEPLECVIRFDSHFLAEVSGYVRLFSEGFAFDSVRYGPMLVPLRIVCSSVHFHGFFGGAAKDGVGSVTLEVRRSRALYGPLLVDDSRETFKVSLMVPAESALWFALGCVWSEYWSSIISKLGLPLTVDHRKIS